MTETPKPKILILESNETISDRAGTILTKEGWDIHSEKTAEQALLRLEESKHRPFNLFISNFKLPKMEGDDILKNAKAISPMTQRMLMVSADKPEIVIRAINKGGINSCIIYPFQDEDLVNQAKNCLTQFQLSIKNQRLKRVTDHQNKQLFQIAQKLKKKGKASQKLIEEKKAEKLMHRANLRKTLKQKDQKTNITLEDRISQNNVSVTAESFQSEFLMLCDYIKALFDSTASKINLNPVVLDFKSLNLKQTPIITTDDTDAADTTNTDDDDTEAAETTDTDDDTKTADTTDTDNDDTEAAETTDTDDDNTETAETIDTAAEDLSDLTQKILKVAFTSQSDPGFTPLQKRPNAGDQKKEVSLDVYFEISVSRDQTKASIQIIEGMYFPGTLTLSSIVDFLHNQGISYGIIDDQTIEAWILQRETKEESLIIAKGEKPMTGQDGQISFHFENDFTNPGKIQGDGTIDFRDRGDIPYVHNGDLLAKKTPVKEGRHGMDVFGNSVLVEEPMDPLFISGNGTEIKEEELEIYAALDGQPNVDAMGNITVNPELMIKGDVDFETGNIDFNGNIIVNGVIKEGFTIKGISLTAREIEGAIIELSGDLHISDGITEAKINSVGNVHAKFINNSTVTGFGDLIIQKEIIDSNIIISGACQNQTGHIISSTIIAKRGIEANKIGTAASKPVILKVGVSEHIKILTQKIEGQLEKSLRQLLELRENIEGIETKDQELYELITQKAQVQEKAENESKQILETIPDLKKTNDIAGVQKSTLRIKKLSKTAETAEQELNKIFETQDLYAKQTDQFKEQITIIEERNKKYVLEKKGLAEFDTKTPPLPQILINGKITQDTSIQGPKSSLTLKDDLSRCQIQEISIQEDGRSFHEMKVSDL
ncbi:MAG: DUF342 domain-containing protein [Desulfobacteraceae bacterium]|nr:DUF342 domain-containing protein [Desulfobacteraceae bacterium]